MLYILYTYFGPVLSVLLRDISLPGPGTAVGFGRSDSSVLQHHTQTHTLLPKLSSTKTISSLQQVMLEDIQYAQQY